MADVPEPTEIDSFSIVRSDHACFGCGDDNPIGLHLQFTRDREGVKASFIPVPEHQGFDDGKALGLRADELVAAVFAHGERGTADQSEHEGQRSEVTNDIGHFHARTFARGRQILRGLTRLFAGDPRVSCLIAG